MQRTPSHLAAEIADRYAVEREIGRGGTAIVHLARDRETGALVALKVLRAELAESLTAERFLREIHVTQQFSHPNIVPVLGSGVAEGSFYCVLKYMDGGTFRDRLDHERQLPLRDVASIARALGAALEYAHARKVIHRDVKPENILFGNGEACLADFGIARALEGMGNSSTSTGVVRGTPAYMSPEQASGERDYDGRSDIYSLACVLYEALAGTPAFVGANSQAVLAQRLIHVPRPLRVYRPTATPELERVMARALAIAPADRYQTVTEFTTALNSAIETPAAVDDPLPSSSPDRGKHRLAWMSAAVLGLAALVYAGTGPLASRMPWATTTPLDTTRYAVLPFEHAANVTEQLDETGRFQAALASWQGVNVADAREVSAAIGSRSVASLSRQDAVKIGRSVGAGRYVRGQVTRIGDSLRFDVSLYNVANDSVLAQVGVNFTNAPTLMAASVQELTDRLLLRQAANAVAEVGESKSLPARQLLRLGKEELQGWNLVTADSAFAHALAFDAGFTRAALWLALVRSWSNVLPGLWSQPLAQAAAQPAHLNAQETQILVALQAEATSTWERACPTWRAIANNNQAEFIGWFGLANCLRRDNAVVRDFRSASRYGFRASGWERVKAFQRAFELQPALLAAGKVTRFALVRDLMFAGATSVRLGWTLPDSAAMVGVPSWAGDTLAFTPFPAAAFSRGAPGTQSPSKHDAQVNMRRRLEGVVALWVQATPRSSIALEALALSMKMLDEPAALDTLVRARSLAVSTGDRVRIAAEEIWFRLERSWPEDSAGLLQVRMTADSLLTNTPPEDAGPLASIAALLGKTYLAARLSGILPPGEPEGRYPLLRRDGSALLVYAAAGGPAERVLHYEEQVTAAILATSTAAERAGLRRLWLHRPARVAYPDVRFKGFAELAVEHDPLIALEWAMENNRPDSARRGLENSREQRKLFSAENVKFESLYPEARLWVLLGQEQTAAEWLDPGLIAMPRADPNVIADLPNAAVIPRAAALRAHLAERARDAATARRWATVVTILWAGADPDLHAELHHMQQITNALPSHPQRP